MIVLAGLIVAILFGVLCYLSTENIFSSIGVTLVTFLYFAIYVNKKMTKKNTKIIRFHECYQFINNFLIALSIKGHISGALASALETQNEDTIDAIKGLKVPDPMAKLKYLRRYFVFDAYNLFLDLVTVYDEEGGDIIKMSHYLSNQIREDEDYIVNVERQHKDSVIEFSILWMFALSILAIIKFALTDFFKMIVKNTFYQVAVVGVFIFVLITFQIAIMKITDIEIKGWNENETDA